MFLLLSPVCGSKVRSRSSRNRRIHIRQRHAPPYGGESGISVGPAPMVAALERGYRDHDSFMFAIKVHPDPDFLRADPRFREPLRRMRLE